MDRSVGDVQVMRQIWLSLLLASALASPLWAQERPEQVLQAAKAGDARAQLEMGILYEFGFYMPENNVPALAWYMLAAKQGDAKAATRRDLLMSRMTQSEIEQARRESESLLLPSNKSQ